MFACLCLTAAAFEASLKVFTSEIARNDECNIISSSKNKKCYRKLTCLVLKLLFLFSDMLLLNNIIYKKFILRQGPADLIITLN